MICLRNLNKLLMETKGVEMAQVMPSQGLLPRIQVDFDTAQLEKERALNILKKLSRQAAEEAKNCQNAQNSLG